MALEFSERQSRTIVTAITIVAALVIVLAVGLLGWLASVFLRTFSGVFLPIVVGAVGALVVRPYYDWLRERLRAPKWAAVALVFITVTLPLTAFLVFFGSMLVSQLTEMATHIPAWSEAVRAWVTSELPRVSDMLERTGMGDRLNEFFEAQRESLLAGLQAVGAQAVSAGVGIVRRAGALLGWAVLPVYFAFFLITPTLRLDSASALPFFKRETRDEVEYLIHEFVDIIVAFFRGQLVVAFLQGLLYAVGFSIVGLRYGFVLGLLLGLLNVIPYLGAMIGLAITIPLSLFQQGGGWHLGLLVLAVIVVVQLIESWVLTPRIMGDRTGLHPMMIIVAIFFWGTALDGIMGMILAIPLTAFLASLWRLARDKYIPEIV